MAKAAKNTATKEEKPEPETEQLEAKEPETVSEESSQLSFQEFPVVGDVVVFIPRGGEEFYGHELAAIVVNSNKRMNEVNLALFNPFGNIIENPPQNIRFVCDPHEELPTTHYATWPSFSIERQVDKSEGDEAS